MKDFDNYFAALMSMLVIGSFALGIAVGTTQVNDHLRDRIEILRDQLWDCREGR